MLLLRDETWLSQFTVTGCKLKCPATRKIHRKSFALRLVNISPRNQNFAQSDCVKCACNAIVGVPLASGDIAGHRVFKKSGVNLSCLNVVVNRDERCGPPRGEDYCFVRFLHARKLATTPHFFRPYGRNHTGLRKVRNEPVPFESLAPSPARVSPLRTCQQNGLPTGTIPTHTAGHAMGGLFYIKQYGNTPTGRKMSNKDTRALPCYYAITYHPFLRPPFNPPRNPYLSGAGTTYIPRTAGYVKQRREYGLMYFMERATSLSYCRLNMHAGHACTT